MQIRRISIQRFRGIRSLEWTLTAPMVCLIGANDSTKTTILDAIEYTLSPRWNISFADTDFYQGDTSQAIEIIVTVGQLPDKITSLNKFGEELNGWNENNELTDEPGQNEAVISIRLRVDASLEPEWVVITNRNPDGTRISAKDRELLGIGRVGSYVDRELAWGRGSALSKFTGDMGTLSAILAQANRTARQAVAGATLSELQSAATRAQTLVGQLGVQPKNQYQPALDAQSVSVNTSGLALHDGEIPLRQLGLGSRRLVALALQKETTKEGAILLIDEIEHGLEPHRLRQLIRMVHPQSNSDGGVLGQTILTTHSPIAIVESKALELHVVRSNGGNTYVKQVSSELQALVRAVPEAFLARKIIVCEGKTEVGILRALDRWWANQNEGKSFAYWGVVAVDGGGCTEAPKKAINLRALGYEVLLLVDSDAPIEPSRTIVESSGVTVIEWADNMNTETRICSDLTWNMLGNVLNLVIDDDNKQSILDQIGNKLGRKTGELGDCVIDNWLSLEPDQTKIRLAIGKAAHSKSWFKRTDLGELLGDVVATDLINVTGTDLHTKLTQLKDWVCA